ncbi:MAG: hypothetical protein AAGE65_05855 [Planctomycetota bacterium]
MAEHLLSENVAREAEKEPGGSLQRAEVGEKPAALSVTQLSELLETTEDAVRRLDPEVQKMDRDDELPMRPEVAGAAEAWREQTKPESPEDLVFAEVPTRIMWRKDLDPAGVIRIEASRVMKRLGRPSATPERRATKGIQRADRVMLHGYRDDRGRVFNRRCLRLSLPALGAGGRTFKSSRPD